MGIVGTAAHSVIVADELEGTEVDISVTYLILNALTEKVTEECVLLKIGRTSEEDTERKKLSFQFCVDFP